MARTDEPTEQAGSDGNGGPIPPVVPIVGYSGSGKTTLLVRVIAELSRRGYRVGTIKHHRHEVELDIPGKDTWRYKQAGAAATLIYSAHRIGLVRDVDDEPSIEMLLSLMPPVDLVLMEGYKRIERPKLEVFRSEVSEKPACLGDPHLVAIISDSPLDVAVPRFSPADIQGVTDFITAHFLNRSIA
jgi:molybdopterin-guanine dinucleotide biosynthesis protein B